MSIQRIAHTGWQARVYIAPGRRKTAYFADKRHGGNKAAFALAVMAESEMIDWVIRARKFPGVDIDAAHRTHGRHTSPRRIVGTGT